MDDNLKNLKKRINAFKIKYYNLSKPKDINSANKNYTNYSKGLNICLDLTASIIVGLIIGLFLDNMFHTKPYALIICLILSSIAGLRLIFIKL